MGRNDNVCIAQPGLNRIMSTSSRCDISSAYIYAFQRSSTEIITEPLTYDAKPHTRP